MRLRGQDDGYAMAAFLVALSVMAILLAVAMPTWKQMARREKEEELVFRGMQYARAIGLFQRKYANAFPPSIDVLVREKFLRKKYKDPITNDDFVPLTQAQANTPGSGTSTTSRPGATPTPSQPLGRTASGGMGTNIGSGAAVGGIIGVASKSKDKSIRIYNGRDHYNEWAFVFTPQMMAPGVGGAPGIGRPGQQPGRPGQQGPGGTPFGRPGQQNPQRPGGNRQVFPPFSPTTPNPVPPPRRPRG